MVVIVVSKIPAWKIIILDSNTSSVSLMAESYAKVSEDEDEDESSDKAAGAKPCGHDGWKF